jgi:glutathione peroxidase
MTMMRNMLVWCVIALAAWSCQSASSNKVMSKPEETVKSIDMESLHSLKVLNIKGEEVSLSKYKGKKVLIVNVASKCGYTPQYGDLQLLHEKYGDKVAVLGFPSNDFGGQEPGTNIEIAQFCSTNYGVTFDMYDKVAVKGKDKHPLYQWLTSKSLNGWNDQEPTWNFCKYLVDEEGHLLKFYASSVNPFDDDLINAIVN